MSKEHNQHEEAAIIDELLREEEEQQQTAAEETTAEEEAQPAPAPEPEKAQEEAAPQPKKGRGRPKGSTKEKSESAEHGSQKKTENVDDFLKTFADTETPKETQAAQQAAAAAPEPPPATVIMNGYMVLMLADFVIPSLISIALPMLSGYEIDTKQLKLDKDERRELKPFADEAAKSLVLNMSPIQLFIICMGSMYAEKTLTYMKKKKL